jgi:hypothetical protein
MLHHSSLLVSAAVTWRIHKDYKTTHVVMCVVPIRTTRHLQ